MKKRIYLRILRALGFMLTVCLPVMLAVYLAHDRAASETQQHLQSFAQLVIAKTEIVIQHVEAAQDEAQRYSGPVCSLEHMQKLQDIARSKLYVEDLIYAHGNAFICSTVYKPSVPFIAPAANYKRKPAISIFYYLDTPFYSGHKMTYMQRGDFIVVVNPRTYADVMSSDPSLIYGVYDTVTKQFFSLSDRVDIKRLHNFILKDDNYFTDEGRVYTVEKSSHRPIAVIVSTSGERFNKEWYHQLTLTVPLGMICSAIILLMWSRSRRQFNSPRRMLLRAIEDNQLKLHYQPVIDIQNGRCVGAEALLRWVNYSGQSISPGTFIPLAEAEGLMQKISEYVINAVFNDFGEFLADHPDLYISINFSAADFHCPRLVTMLSEKIKKYGVNAGQIKLEVTERGFIDVPKTRPVIQAFRQAGFEIAIDDFGTGYANLHNLQYLNVDILKIDKSFIDNIPADRACYLIAEHIIDMAHSLNLKTIAEGVETQEQVTWLQARGVQYCQGWYFAKALPPQEFIAWLYRPGSGKDVAFAE
ncbi:EAL domain-containing protein [Enterobacter sp. R1(2018)]|uniref:EAL domain-containing protein n=1 Tax=Enterobacter sp. R1(2018) TaxID=2447891 RepID=UPI000EB309DF|nr:EAL domain-containing protein [Enterobacter sp. R1(2018)]RKQ40274.1 EAL domain-containing protein [Enterobacter sp. R1(2018)]